MLHCGTLIPISDYPWTKEHRVQFGTRKLHVLILLAPCRFASQFAV